MRKKNIAIVGGGFGGLYAAKSLGNSPFNVTLIDKRNFHLFQPLLYQVAIGELPTGEIAFPLRTVLRSYPNIRTMLNEVIDIDPVSKTIVMRDEAVGYDYLILSPGSSHSYFGHDAWEKEAPGLKTIEDALNIRRRIFLAFEEAENEEDPEQRAAWMTFVIVGGGPTGVELAGALGELAHNALCNDFRSIRTQQSKILLLEGGPRILPTYAQELSENAFKELNKLGVSVRTNTRVTDIRDHIVTVKEDHQEQKISAKTILWAAGVKVSPLAKVLQTHLECGLDKIGRVIVNSDLSIPNHPDIFVIGDLANFPHQGGKPLPGVAAVAMQEGEYVAKLLINRFYGRETQSFHYFDKGSLAVIGRNAAVAEIGKIKVTGLIAWIIWALVHIRYLIGFGNRLLVMLQWSWSYFTRRHGSRLITGYDFTYPAGESGYSMESEYGSKAVAPHSS